MNRVLLSDVARPLAESPRTGHNRWHEAIPPLATIAPGEIVELAVRDSGDRQVTPHTTLEEHLSVDIDRCHPLSGPLYVETVEPGDIVEVAIHDIQSEPFGWSALYPEAPGLLSDFITEPFLARWTLADGYARSEDVPGVQIPGRPFLGVIGVAPSTQHRRRLTAAEATYAHRGGAVLLPDPACAQPASEPVQSHGLRTMAARNIGGNLDITDVVSGSRVLLPVDVAGALVSFGDMHFAQGDGEAPGLAIETGGRVQVSCMRRTVEELGWRPTHPVITRPAGKVRDNRPCLVTTGISTDLDGTCHGFDLERAVRRAFEEMLEYLVAARGYTRSQALTITSVAVDLRVNALGNTPGAVATAVLPLDIFDDPAPGR